MKGLIKDIGTDYALVYVPMDKSWELEKQEVTECEVTFCDGRTITPEQRKMAYATIRDISAWSGHSPDYLKEWFKFDLLSGTGGEYFSLSDCSVSQANEYITYLVEFCLKNNVPTTEPLLNRNNDIGKYLYACLLHRKCAICNSPKAHLHHVDRVGMGRNRDKIIHEGMEAIALCALHHAEAHKNEAEFFYKYRVYGIKLDNYLCQKLKLKQNKGKE